MKRQNRRNRRGILPTGNARHGATPGSGPRSHPDHTMGGTATDSAGLRISHENPVFTTNRRGARGDTHAIQDGLRGPGYGGDKSISDGFVQAKSGKLANAPTSLRNAPPFGAIPAATDIAVIDIAVFEIKDLNRQASANGTLRLRPPSGKSGAPLPGAPGARPCRALARQA
ncbi:hypothetical protein WJ972_33815 [Achromobacter insuavis]